uniref:Si:ch211-131k2.2 n=2 Tax=Astyanax mexicanus TaxID=7994 RepID=A0A3B1KK53_ASTMX
MCINVAGSTRKSRQRLQISAHPPPAYNQSTPTESAMEIWKLQVVVISMTALACSSHGLSFTLDKERWISKNWEDGPLVEKLASEVASLIKRSKAHQFYGLMGKRSGIPQPMRMDRRRNKGEMFVGLMGRRSLRGDSLTRIIPAETSTVNNAAMESDQQSDAAFKEVVISRVLS